MCSRRALRYLAGVRDTPRLLARNSTRAHPILGIGYTDEPAKALAGEPEAVSRDDQLLITARAHRSARETQRDEWLKRRVAIQREIDWLHSQRFARNVSRPLRTLRHQIAYLDKVISQV